MARFSVASLRILAGSSLLAAALAAGAEAAPREPFMPTGERVAPPRGYIDFCAREPADCPAALRARPDEPPAGRLANYWRAVFEAVEPAALPHGPPSLDPSLTGAVELPAEAAPLPTTAALWRELDSVNRSVNARMVAASDASVYGRSDYWALPLERGTRLGDCEDYVLEKRRALRALGYPDRLLSIALVTTTWGEKHAVLLVRTDQGEYVLDSLNSRIVAWQDTPYRWVSRQSPDDTAIWVAGPDYRHGRGAARRR
jgi:predicted transglutaminase-like cysteine proteinase